MWKKMNNQSSKWEAKSCKKTVTAELERILLEKLDAA